MTDAATTRRSDPPDLTGCYEGWAEDEELARLYDCRSWPNKTLVRRTHASELGVPLREVRVSVIYARWLTLQEQWDDFGRDQWAGEWVDARGAKYAEGSWHLPDGSPVSVPEPPKEPPETWQPDEYRLRWTSCKRTDDGAVRCWRAEWA